MSLWMTFVCELILLGFMYGFGFSSLEDIKQNDLKPLVKPIAIFIIGQVLIIWFADDGHELPQPNTATSKRPTLNLLDTRHIDFRIRSLPGDVILHAGRYVVTGTANGRIVAFKATRKEYSVLYEAKAHNVASFQPSSILALSDTEDSFLITGQDKLEKRGFVVKLEDNDLTKFPSKFYINTPTGIALNRKRDRVYIADCSDQCIIEFKMDGTYLGKRGRGNLKEPCCIACNSQNNIYVTDEEGIKVFDPNWRYINTVTINILESVWCYRGIAIDAFDNIFITAHTKIDASSMKGTVAVINANHKLVLHFTRSGIHFFPGGVCIDYDMNRVIVATGMKQMIEIFSLY